MRDENLSMVRKNQFGDNPHNPSDCAVPHKQYQEHVTTLPPPSLLHRRKKNYLTQPQR